MNPVEAVTKILIVDDSPLIRKYITRLLELEPDFKVCGQAENGPSALQAIEDQRPDMVLVDISFGGNEAGIDLMHAINARDPNLPMLAISLHEKDLYGDRVLRAGARGYLMKQEAPDQLIAAIRQILKGDLSHDGMR